MLKVMDRPTLTTLPSLADREREWLHPSYISSSGGTVKMSWTFRELETRSPAPRPPQAGTERRRGELKESMYRDEPLAWSSIAILDVPGFGLDEAAAFEAGRRFMRLPRPPAAPPSWVAPLDDVDS